MPVGLVILVSFLGAAGAVVGGFVVTNLLASLFASSDSGISNALEKIGTDMFRKSVAGTVVSKKPAAAAKVAQPAAATAGAAPAGHGAAAAPAEHGAATAAAATSATSDGKGNNPSLTSIAKVWIEPGCIVCDACVNTCPEVFKIEGDTCIVLPNSDLTKVQEIKDAAAGCPVDVIKYS
jgi:ferredoxin